MNINITISSIYTLPIVIVNQISNALTLVVSTYAKQHHSTQLYCDATRTYIRRASNHMQVNGNSQIADESFKPEFITVSEEDSQRELEDEIQATEEHAFYGREDCRHCTVIYAGHVVKISPDYLEEEFRLLNPSVPEKYSVQDHLPICPGYLNNTLRIFHFYCQPFLLIGTQAMRWSGCHQIEDRHIDVLVRYSHLKLLSESLIQVGEWKISRNWAEEKHAERYQRARGDAMINQNAMKEIWLKSTLLDPVFEF